MPPNQVYIAGRQFAFLPSVRGHSVLSSSNRLRILVTVVLVPVPCPKARVRVPMLCQALPNPLSCTPPPSRHTHTDIPISLSIHTFYFFDHGLVSVDFHSDLILGCVSPTRNGTLLPSGETTLGYPVEISPVPFIR